MDKRWTSDLKHYGGKSYRSEGALLMNRVARNYDIDARIYIDSANFELGDYKMKEDSRLIVRTAGSNDPRIRNADRITKDTAGVLAFIKRMEKEGHKEFVVQRYPNEDRIYHAVSAIFEYDKMHSTEVYIDIRKMPPEFLEKNMNSDRRQMTSRDFQQEFEAKVSSKEKFEYHREPFKESMEELGKLFKRMHWAFAHTFKAKVIDPTFLGVILENNSIFPVDMKRISHKPHKR